MASFHYKAGPVEAPPWTLLEALLGIAVVLFVGPAFGLQLLQHAPVSPIVAKQLGAWSLAFGYLGWLQLRSQHRVNEEALPYSSPDFWRLLGVFKPKRTKACIEYEAARSEGMPEFSMTQKGFIIFGLLTCGAVLYFVTGHSVEELRSDYSSLLSNLQRYSFSFVMCSVVTGPLLEELLFRGLLQPAWQAKKGGWPGILAPAALFAVLHMVQSPLVFPIVFAWGVMGLIIFAISVGLGRLRYDWQTIWIGFFIHGLLNLGMLLIH